VCWGRRVNSVEVSVERIQCAECVECVEGVQRVEC